MAGLSSYVELVPGNQLFGVPDIWLSYRISPSFRKAFPKAIAQTGGPPLCEYRHASGYSS
jgi:hypothetical protein